MEKKYHYIYKITCTNGRFKDKFYYGQHSTNNLNDEYKGSGTKLMNYYKKYPEGYIKEIISFYNTQEELNKAEYDIIHDYLNNSMCLNLRDGGNIGEISKESLKKYSLVKLGHKVSEETKEKISKGHIGKKLSDEHKKKLSESHKGKKLSDETKKKLSEISKEIGGRKPGFYLSDEQKLKISKKLLYHIVTDETKEKISKGNIGKKVSDETRKKLSELHKGKKLSDEHKKKLSEKTKQYWLNKKVD